MAGQLRGQTKQSKFSLIDQLNRGAGLVESQMLEEPDTAAEASLGPGALEISDQIDVQLSEKVSQASSAQQQRNRSSKADKVPEKNASIDDSASSRTPRSHRHLNPLVPSSAHLTPLGHMRAQKYNLFMSTMLHTLDPNNSDFNNYFKPRK